MQRYTIYDFLTAAQSLERFKALVQDQKIIIDDKTLLEHNLSRASLWALPSLTQSVSPKQIEMKNKSLNALGPMDPDLLLANLEHNLKVVVFYLQIRNKIDEMVKEEFRILGQREHHLKKLRMALTELIEKETLEEDLAQIEEMTRERARLEPQIAQAVDKIENDTAKTVKEVLAVITEVKDNISRVQTIKDHTLQAHAEILAKNLGETTYFRNKPDEVNLALSRDFLVGMEKVDEKISEEITTYEAMQKELTLLAKQIAQKKRELGLENLGVNIFTTLQGLQKMQQNPELAEMQARAHTLQQKLIEINAEIDACRHERNVLPINLSEIHGVSLNKDITQHCQQFYEKAKLQGVGINDIQKKLEAYLGKTNRSKEALVKKTSNTLRRI